MELRLTPSSKSKPINFLLLITVLFSIFSSFLSPWLSLSLEGIHRLYLWQLISYLFIHPFPSGLIHLAFNLYLLWIFGTSLIERLKTKSFFILYFGSGLCAALFAIIPMLWVPGFLFGCTPSLYAILVSWVLLNPDASILLFFTFPFRARTLLTLLIGISLLIDLSRADWIPLCTTFGAILFSYFFTLIVYRMRSPFSILMPMETIILQMMERLKHKKNQEHTHTKIYDFKSGEPILNDDQFMDAMLTRISLYGEEILTCEEKQRMQRISQKKASKKP